MFDSKAVPCREIRSQIFVHARQIRVLLWAEIIRGACEQTDGQLTLRSDGSGTWTCTTTSSNSHDSDVWHTDFALRDASGQAIFGVGPFYSPLMSSSKPASECSWSQSFSFPAELFSSVHSATQNCGCLPPVYALRQATPSQPLADQSRSTSKLFLGMERVYA